MPVQLRLAAGAPAAGAGGLQRRDLHAPAVSRQIEPATPRQPATRFVMSDDQQRAVVTALFGDRRLRAML
jgi:hypothetical protein